MIPWINSMGLSWGRSARRILGDVSQSRPTAATLEAVRQELVLLRAQPVRMPDVDDAVLIANAISQAPVMPLPLLASMWVTYVVGAPLPKRVTTLACLLGRREGEAMTRAEYWRAL